MIDCCAFVEALAAHGWEDAAGVPCSTFAGPIAHLDRLQRYEASANEGTALASAAGAALAGRRRAVLLQNSGLGNLINPLASLVVPYALPVLAFMSLRGWPDPAADEPQHEVMGRSGARILAALGIWHAVLDGETARLRDILDAAQLEVEAGRPAFVLVPVGTLGRHPGPHPEHAVRVDFPCLPSSSEIAETIRRSVGEDTLVISTTGHLSRHLFAAGDRPRNFYMQGSMGHAAALALGYCTAHPDANAVVLDGDGAALMHLGVLSTIGAAAPGGLTHIVVDNGGYASTGGQPASTRHTDLTAVALACGYRSAVSAASTAELSSILNALRDVDGPHFILVESRNTADPPPPRPSAALRLPDLTARVTGRTATNASAGSRP